MKSDLPDRTFAFAERIALHSHDDHQEFPYSRVVIVPLDVGNWAAYFCTDSPLLDDVIALAT